MRPVRTGLIFFDQNVMAGELVSDPAEIYDTIHKIAYANVIVTPRKPGVSSLR